MIRASALLLLSFASLAFSHSHTNGLHLPAAFYFEGTLQQSFSRLGKLPIKYGLELDRSGNVTLEEYSVTVSVFSGLSVTTSKLCRGGQEYVVTTVPFAGTRCKVVPRKCDVTLGRAFAAVMFAKRTDERCRSPAGSGLWYNETFGQVSYSFCVGENDGVAEVYALVVRAGRVVQTLEVTKWKTGEPEVFVDTRRCGPRPGPRAMFAKAHDEGMAALAGIEAGFKPLMALGRRAGALRKKA